MILQDCPTPPTYKTRHSPSLHKSLKKTPKNRITLRQSDVFHSIIRLEFIHPTIRKIVTTSQSSVYKQLHTQISMSPRERRAFLRLYDGAVNAANDYAQYLERAFGVVGICFFFISLRFDGFIGWRESLNFKEAALNWPFVSYVGRMEC